MRKLMVGTVVILMLSGSVASAQSSRSAPGASGPFTVDVEALAWWFKHSPTPVPIITDDVFGRPGTNTLLGGGDADTNPHPGLRLTGAYAIDRRWGVQGNFLYLAQRSTSQSVSSSGNA